MRWLLIFGLMVAGCASESSPSKVIQASDPPLVSPAATPDAVPAMPSADANFPGSLGQEVTIVGKFSGWRGTCKGTPPVSKSDWMLTTVHGCIYVHGPVPQGFSLASPDAGGGKSVSVRGQIAVDKRGNKYLELK